MSINNDKKNADHFDSSGLVIVNIMRNQDGRDFIWGYLQFCGVFESITGKDLSEITYRTAQRDAGLHLERQIKKASPAYYLKMIEENI